MIEVTLETIADTATLVPFAPPTPAARPKIKRKKGVSKLYFGTDAQDAIELYIDNLIGTVSRPFDGVAESEEMVGWFTSDSSLEGKFKGTVSGGIVGYVEEGPVSGSTVRNVDGYLSASMFGPGPNKTYMSGVFDGSFVGSFESEDCRQIYTDHIRIPFETLVNSLIHTYKINFFGEDIYHVSHECVGFLYETLPKYNPKNKTKAFSYFNVCAKHWLFQRSERLKLSRQRSVDIFDAAVETQIEESDKPSHSRCIEDVIQEMEFVPALMTEFDVWLADEDIHPDEARLIETVKVLFQNAGDIETINRKMGYQLIREIGGLSASEVTKRIRSIRDRYKEFKQKYDSGLI